MKPEGKPPPPNDGKAPRRAKRPPPEDLASISLEKNMPTPQEEWDFYDKKERQAALDDRTQDTSERKRYASRVFVLICCWVGAILSILFFQGFLSQSSGDILLKWGSAYFRIPWRFSLSDPVLLALIGSTTVNIIGLFVIVMNYLFPKRSAPAAGERKKPASASESL